MQCIFVKGRKTGDFRVWYFEFDSQIQEIDTFILVLKKIVTVHFS